MNNWEDIESGKAKIVLTEKGRKLVAELKSDSWFRPRWWNLCLRARWYNFKEILKELFIFKN